MECVKGFTYSFVAAAEEQRHEAKGAIGQSLLSALRASSQTFADEERKNEGKEVHLVERSRLSGVVNPGMPCRALPEQAHLEVQFCDKCGSSGRGETPEDGECVTFSVGATGRHGAEGRPVVKCEGLREAGLELCVFAPGGETVREALVKDGRFVAEVEGEGWALAELRTSASFPPAHAVDQLNGRAFEVEFKSEERPGSKEARPESGVSEILRALAVETGQYLNGKTWEAVKEEFEALTGGSLPNRFPSNISKLPLGLSEAVGSIKWTSVNGEEENASCFHLAKGYVLTCYHVVKMIVGDGTPESEWSKAIRDSAQVNFTIRTTDETEWKVRENGLRAYSSELDYALLGLEVPDSRASELRQGVAGWASKPVAQGVVYSVGREFADSLMLVPLTQEAEDSDLSARRAFQTFSSLSFSTQSPGPERLAAEVGPIHRPGASGSPVFNNYGRLIGMHAGGYWYQEHLLEFGPTIQAIAAHIHGQERAFYQLLFHGNATRNGCVVM